jgi:hypothetical protein
MLIGQAPWRYVGALKKCSLEGREMALQDWEGHCENWWWWSILTWTMPGAMRTHSYGTSGLDLKKNSRISEVVEAGGRMWLESPSCSLLPPPCLGEFLGMLPYSAGPSFCVFLPSAEGPHWWQWCSVGRSGPVCPVSPSQPVPGCSIKELPVSLSELCCLCSLLHSWVSYNPD